MKWELERAKTWDVAKNLADKEWELVAAETQVDADGYRYFFKRPMHDQMAALRDEAFKAAKATTQEIK